MKKSDDIKKEMDDLLTEAQALQNRAERENRDFTAAEQSRWNAIMTDETGEIAVLEKQFKAAVRQETEVNRLRSLQTEVNQPVNVYDRLTGGATESPSCDARVISKKFFAFKGPDAARDAHDCGLWLKSQLLAHSPRHAEAEAAKQKVIARRGQSWYASQNETTATDGGYLVPPQLEAAVMVYREQVGALRKLARVIPIASDTWTGIKQTTGTTVYYPGEEGEIIPSQAQFSRYTLTMKKRAILTYVSSELRDDSMPAVMDLLAADMGHQFALKEDQEGIAGDGTSTYGGVQGIRPAVAAATASISTAASSHTTWADLDFSDFAATMSLLADKYRVTGQLSWLCSAAFKWQVMDRLAINSNGALSIVFVEGQPIPMFLGYPIVISDRMPTTSSAGAIGCLFGNFPGAVVLGERTGIALATSEHVAFTSDRIAVRGITRYDINVHQEGDTSTAGAIVGLATHS